MSELVERFVARAEPRAVRAARAVAGALLGGRSSLEGERVALFVPPGSAFVEGLFGVFMAGGCAVVLSPLHPARETRYFCDDAGVRTVVASSAFAELAEPLRDGFTVVDVDELRARGAERSAEVARDAPALQLYTSGTTGRPKGAVLTHQNLAVQQRLVGEAWGFSEGDVLLHALPLHHMHGLAIALLTAIGSGARVTFMPFDARAIWSAMDRATVFMGVPAMYHRLLGAFEGADPSERARWAANARGLRLATSGSAALPVGVAERWRAIQGDIPLERFGMTEIGVGITNSLRGERFPGCVGQPLPTVEARIVGDDGEDAETGELLIRGPSVFVGYHEREEETGRAFTADDAGGAPWFRTGDTVTRERSLPGAPYRVLGRTSVDILKSGGYKLSALEIEEVLREHAAVGEVAVVGVPDEAWGERVVACVVRRADQSCDVEGLRAFVRERLAPYKVPKEIVFLGELPKNALGKVVKPELVRSIARPVAGSPA